jgi:hypothetical protein
LRERAETFRTCAKEFMTSHDPEWRNDIHREPWRASLETYAYPIIGDVPIADIDTALVLKVLQPIWAEKTVTATRAHIRIERVLSWAKIRGYARAKTRRYGGAISTIYSPNLGRPIWSSTMPPFPIPRSALSWLNSGPEKAWQLRL